jgi:putative ABC transport system permease protein
VRGAALTRRAGASLLRLVTLGLDPGLRPLLSRNLGSRPGRAALTALAVCLGVAVMLGVQVDIAGVAAQARSAAAMRAGGSGVDVRAASAAGLTSAQIHLLGSLPGVARAVPLYQKRVTADPGASGSAAATVTLVGLEGSGAALRPVAVTAGRLPGPESRDEVAVDSGLLGALGGKDRELRLGDSLLLTSATGPRRFTVVGVTGAGGVAATFTQDAVFLPAAELLRDFELGLHASLVALGLTPGVDPGAVAAEVHLRLGGAVTAVEPGADSGDPLTQLAPLLLLVSILSVVIGAGVAANTVSLAALERRRDIGLLRAAGASGAQVFRLLTAEALLLAAAGSAAGAAAGIGLGALLQADLAGSSPFPVPLQVHPLTVLLAALAGTVAATLAAALPAAAAARLPILEALSPEAAGRRERVRAAALGAVPPLLALTALADLGGPAAVAVGSLALLVAVGLCLPLIAPPLSRLLARGLRRLWPEGEVAAATLARRRNRTALTLSGLVTAVGAAVASSVLVAGSLASGDDWVHQLFLGDTLVRSPVTEPAAIAGQISQAAGVEVTTLRFFPVLVDDDVVGVTALDSRLEASQGGLEVVGGDRAAALAALPRTAALLAPVELAEADGWQVGTRLAVAAPHGTVIFTVAGLVQHSFPAPDGRETLVMDAGEAQRIFGAAAGGFDALEVLTPGRSAAVAGAAGRYGLSAVPVSDVAGSVRAALDSTIGLLPAVAGAAVAIAMLAVVNTLTVSVRSGRRELALLRAVGLSAAQARRYVLAQAGYLGATAGLLGLGVGCLLALPMLQASRSPGFLPSFALPWLTVAALAAAVVGGALAAALIPAHRAARADIVSAMQHE